MNNQPTYAVPPGSSKVLISDLTLPESISSVKIVNLGTAQQWDIAGLYVFEDGPSSGWDGDEKEIGRNSVSPFWDVKISVTTTSQSRIFLAADIASSALSGATIKPEIEISSGAKVTGPERIILAGTSIPLVPSTPLAQSGEAVSATSIRWKFLDLANNEFGFRILDSQLKRVAIKEASDLSFLEETGLNPGTCYSGRRVTAFNDRGESAYSSIFSEVCTLAAPAATPTPIPVATPTPESIPTTTSTPTPTTTLTPTPTPTLTLTPTPSPTAAVTPEPEPALNQEESLKSQIIEVQQKIVGLLQQLIQLLQEQIEAAQASIFNAFKSLTGWLEEIFQ